MQLLTIWRADSCVWVRSHGYLAKGQTILILVLVFDLKVVQRFALRRRLAQRTQQLDVAGGQEAVAAVELAVVPVVVHFASQDDDVTLGELQVARLFAFVRVEGFAAWQRRDVLEVSEETWQQLSTFCSFYFLHFLAHCQRQQTRCNERLKQSNIRFHFEANYMASIKV